jgi:hypothetical protein
MPGIESKMIQVTQVVGPLTRRPDKKAMMRSKDTSEHNAIASYRTITHF